MNRHLFRQFPCYCLMILLSASLLLAGCGKTTSAPPAASPEKEEPLVIGLMPDVESIPLIVAEKNGYFEAAGADVELEIFQSARDRDSALQAGLLDGMVTDMVAVIFARTGGTPLKIISRTDGNILLLGDGVESLADLSGKSVGLSTNTVMEFSLDQMLLAAGMDPAAIEKTAVPALPTRLEMLLNHNLAAAILPQPLAGMALASGAALLCDTQQLGEKAGALAFTEQALAEKAGNLRAFIQAYNQAAEELNRAEPGAYDAFASEKLGFPEGTGQLTLPEYQPIRLPETAVFDHVLAWMQERELLTQPLTYADITADLSDPEP